MLKVPARCPSSAPADIDSSRPQPCPLPHDHRSTDGQVSHDRQSPDRGAVLGCIRPRSLILRLDCVCAGRRPDDVALGGTVRPPIPGAPTCSPGPPVDNHIRLRQRQRGPERAGTGTDRARPYASLRAAHRRGRASHGCDVVHADAQLTTDDRVSAPTSARPTVPQYFTELVANWVSRASLVRAVAGAVKPLVNQVGKGMSSSVFLIIIKPLQSNLGYNQGYAQKNRCFAISCSVGLSHAASKSWCCYDFFGVGFAVNDRSRITRCKPAR